jgi:hypothetical protein
MPEVTELIGVYDADGTVRGELAYAFRKLTGRGSCALCDITHRDVRRRPEFDVAIATLSVPFTLVHRNERTDDLLAAGATRPPCVLARTEAGVVKVLDADALARCGSDPEALLRALENALRDLDLPLPRLHT